MSSDQLTVALAASWFVWTATVCQKRRISWIPLVPLVALLGLGLALLVNRFISPGGVLLEVVAFILPLYETGQLIKSKARK
jgi:hypothetical protein